MLLIGNGRVITRDDALPYLADGAVALDGERVGEVGPLDEMCIRDRCSTHKGA